ncbi:metalloregulator ArsR/SmtB family transcription factor [Thalassotalea maritima]|uniref:metalloregulator ArsR/SmtB family transcription factor n=1 Tax=Thalassotalea maritima TaxID=3242416 RepID=UPI00352775A6
MNPIDFYKALADETRLIILLLLVEENELCVCELVTALNYSQPKISRHLALLKQAGLLCDRKQKQWVYYRLNSSLPDWCHQVLQTTELNNNELIISAQHQLRAMQNPPESNCS